MLRPVARRFSGDIEFEQIDDDWRIIEVNTIVRVRNFRTKSTKSYLIMIIFMTISQTLVENLME